MRTLSTLVHQAVISANTLLTTVCLAHLLGRHDFGLFATGFAGLLFALGLNRCMVTDAAIITSGDLDPATPATILHLLWTRRRTWLIVTGATTILALGAALFTQQLFLLVAALGAPLVMSTDTFRYVNIAIGRRHRAVVVDAIQFAIASVAAAMTLALFRDAALFLCLAWCLGPIVAIMSTAPRRVRPEPTDLRPSSSLVRGLLIDYLAQTGLAQVALFGVAFVVSVTTVGEIRLVSTLFGVFSTAVQAISSLGLASMVQARQKGWTGLLQVTRRASVTALGLATANFALVYLLPLRLLELAIGNGAGAARDLAPWMYAATVAQSLAIAPMMRLRASGKVRSILRVRRYTAPGQLVLPIVLASIFGGRGALTGIASTSALVAALAFRETRIEQKHSSPARKGPLPS